MGDASDPDAGRPPGHRSHGAPFQPTRLLGTSPRFRAALALVQRVAPTEAGVLIRGETGTGKELAARAIHYWSPRSGGPFVPVNCGAIPGELMESELFGHKRGSFTGAHADRIGLVQSAEGGTLFLDEVADLPLHLQVKLLRVIQEKTIRRVGDSAETAVDVRIVSATHKNLVELVEKGKFREDLYYRINVIELRVPPLRERLDDLQDLSDAILRRLGLRMQMQAPRLDEGAMERLRGYPFPGNVRELENILERALTLCDGETISAMDVQLRELSQRHDTPQPRAPGGGQAPATLPATSADPVDVPQPSPTPADAGSPLGNQIEELERTAILRALEQTRYNRTAAAKLLGMTFRALRYRIKKLGIE